MEVQMGHGVFSSFTLSVSSYCHPFWTRMLPSAFPAASWALPSSRLQSLGEEREPVTAPTKLLLCSRAPDHFPCSKVGPGPLSPTLKCKKREGILLQPGEPMSLSHSGCCKYSLGETYKEWGMCLIFQNLTYRSDNSTYSFISGKGAVEKKRHTQVRICLGQ